MLCSHKIIENKKSLEYYTIKRRATSQEN